jgi:phosphate transport system substrate-binding protein
MTKWASVYNNEQGVKVDYSSTGSSNGIQQMIKKIRDFGCTDAPMNPEELEAARGAGGDVVHIPVVMGGVVPAYNLPGVEQELRFTGPILADIYLGKVKKWNDPALAAINPGVELPDRDIAVVHRSDGSGTTYIWSDYLSQVSPEWKEKVGVNTILSWPCGIGAKGTEGVSGQITRSQGSIGYVELTYARQNNTTYGSVKNRNGEFVKASLESVTAAAQGALKSIPPDLRYSMVNAPGKDAYPIAGTTWAVAYQKPPEGKAEMLVKFLRWVTHEGQQYTKDLQYAPLPEEMVKRIDEKLKLMESAEPR